MDIEQQLINAIEAVGLNPPNEIIIDGKAHRFDDRGSGKSDGFYILNDAGGDIYWGSYGTWHGGYTPYIFSVEDHRELTADEKIRFEKIRADAKKQLAIETERKHKETAEKAQYIISQANLKTEGHPYLKLKGINGYDVAISRRDGKLIIPILDIDTDELCNLQFISDDGKFKRPLTGGKKGYYTIGDIHNSDVVFIAEGYATAASIYEATKKPVIIAFDSGQLSKVGQKMRQKIKSETKIVFVADNDHLNKDTGKIKSNEAAAKIGADVVLIPAPPDRNMDANDYAQEYGIDKLSELFNSELSSIMKFKLDIVSAEEFTKQPAPIRYYIKKLLPIEALIMIVAISGAMKSFLAVDWGMCIASGLKDWFGFTVKRGTVLYLAGEGHRGIKKRMALWCQKRGVNPGDIGFYISKRGTDLTDADNLADAIRAIKFFNPDVVFIDTLNRFMSGDENTAEGMGAFFNACKELHEVNKCSIVVVHHSGHGIVGRVSGSGRGWSGQKGLLDSMIEIKTKEEDGQCVNPRTLVQSKAKDGECINAMELNLVQYPVNGWVDDEGFLETSCLIEKPRANDNSDAGQYIRDILIDPVANIVNTIGRGGFNAENNIIDIKVLRDEVADYYKIAESTAKKYCQPSAPGCIFNPIKGDIVGWNDSKKAWTIYLNCDNARIQGALREKN